MSDYLKEYSEVPYQPSKGYPGGMNRYYRCIICGDILPSMPQVGMACGCGNILCDQQSVRVKRHDKQPQLLKKKSIIGKLFRATG